MKDAPLSKDQAKVQLNLCLNDGFVSYTKHFKEELFNDGLTMEDTLAICRDGLIVRVPEKDIKTGDWKYRIEGCTADRESVAIVFTLKAVLKAVLITVFKRTNG